MDGRRKMITMKVDQEKLKGLYLQKIDEHLQELESVVFFVNSKQLATYLNMSWNKIVTHILYDEEFPKIRLGSKWLFHKKEVGKYMERYNNEVRKNGGSIVSYIRK
ncbi:hypothetical protein CSV77_06855 [Sporosarcina sp. P16b]|uniref:DNA-binding protein n=1 Tax=Sporosarcina sp. P16b TaxID=2048261 RepID=UPI000C167F08|nr:DNA-binding protein [Sporosarcina sp. P16b]PIC70635.1 hypothetical protein CSV77_06855 [Sporosarcina sp. P16b]